MVSKPKKIPKGFIWDSKNKELVDVRCNNPKLNKLVDTSIPIHAHCAWFGSELACKECNPVCYKNHQMGNPNHLNPCGNINCPLNSKRPEKTLGLQKPALCMSPFFTGKAAEDFIKQDKKPLSSKQKAHLKKCSEIYKKNPIKETHRGEEEIEKRNPVRPKRQRQKQVPWQHYPHIAVMTSSSKLRRMLLGKQLYWTIKEDGENMCIWKKKRQYRMGYDVVISSHNQEIAAQDLQVRVKMSPEYATILRMIKDNPTFRVYVEECKKGLSVTRIKKYPQATLIVFDIFDTAILNFLPYTLVYQHCYHYGIPVVRLHGITRHKSMKDLLKYKNHVLKVCEAIKEEGMVAKTFDKDGEYIMAKVKLDTPEPKERVIHEGQVQLPQIPENEILGAISKVEADHGLDGTAKHDMPLVAKYVAEECNKHLYSSRPNLFKFYQEYMESRKK